MGAGSCSPEDGGSGATEHRAGGSSERGAATWSLNDVDWDPLQACRCLCGVHKAPCRTTTSQLTKKSGGAPAADGGDAAQALRCCARLHLMLRARVLVPRDWRAQPLPQPYVRPPLVRGVGAGRSHAHALLPEVRCPLPFLIPTNSKASQSAAPPAGATACRP